MSVERVTFLLGTCGLAAREVRNALLPVIHKLPDAPRGFGIIGPTGIGKTIALVQHLAAQIRPLAEDMEAKLPFNFARWVNWPDMAEELKGLSGPANWQAQDELLERLCNCSRLYLDDLGQERIRGEEDLALGHLRVILDARYRSERPVFWTSNLGLEQLSKVYGARTASRMCEAWPPAKIAGNDIRMRGLRRPE